MIKTFKVKISSFLSKKATPTYYGKDYLNPSTDSLTSKQFSSGNQKHRFQQKLILKSTTSFSTTTKKGLKFEYGSSNFPRISRKGNFYVDRTNFISSLEEIGRVLLFLRPRRFGKSLLISTLRHYYSVEFKEQFESLFGHLKIGSTPTPERNSYLTMTLNFGTLNLTNIDKFEESLNNEINLSIENFIEIYKKIVTPDLLNLDKVQIFKTDAISSFRSLTDAIQRSSYKGKFYLFIDEYDASMNQLISQDKSELYDLLKIDENKSRKGQEVENSYKRIFSAIKQANDDCGRIFITGVSSLSLDNFTSGFNIAEDISNSPVFDKMCGFVQEDIKKTLMEITTSPTEIDKSLNVMKIFYDGYKFHVDQKEEDKIYNPTLCTYFLKHLVLTRCPPQDLMDVNLRPSLSVIEMVSKNFTSYEIIKSLINNNQIETKDFNRRFSTNMIKGSFFDENFLLSLMYHNGALTYGRKSNEKDRVILKIPNLVMQKIFLEEALNFIGYSKNKISILLESIKALIKDKNIIPLCEFIKKNQLSSLKFQDVEHSQEQDIKSNCLMALNLGFKSDIHVENELDLEIYGKFGQADITIGLPPKIHIEFKNLKVKDFNRNGIQVDFRFVGKHRNPWENDVELCHLIDTETDEEKIMNLKLVQTGTVKTKWEELKTQACENRNKIMQKYGVNGKELVSFVVLRIGLFRLKAERLEKEETN